MAQDIFQDFCQDSFWQVVLAEVIVFRSWSSKVASCPKLDGQHWYAWEQTQCEGFASITSCSRWRHCRLCLFLVAEDNRSIWFFQGQRRSWCPYCSKGECRCNSSFKVALGSVSEHTSQRLEVGLHLSGTATLKRETFESNSLFQPSRRVAPTVGLSSNLWSSRHWLRGTVRCLPITSWSKEVDQNS